MQDLTTLESPFVTHLGILTEKIATGHAEMRLPIKHELRNSGGMPHGGALATLADCVAGAAAFSVLPEGKMAVTTDFNLTCLKVAKGDSIDAEARLIHAGKRFMRAEARLHSAGELVATAGVSFMIIDRPVPSR